MIKYHINTFDLENSIRKILTHEKYGSFCWFFFVYRPSIYSNLPSVDSNRDESAHWQKKREEPPTVPKYLHFPAIWIKFVTFYF